MTVNGWLQILVFFLIILAITKPMGVFMAHVFNREKTFLDPVLRPIERLIYKLTRVDEKREMRWTEYAVALLLFSIVSMLVLYGIQRLQAVLGERAIVAFERLMGLVLTALAVEMLLNGVRTFTAQIGH